VDPKRWQHIEQVYHAALELDPENRNAFLAESCHDDADLIQEVVRLISQDSGSRRVSSQTAGGVTVEPTDVLPVGLRLGPYQVLGPLGEGGMGRVYRALDTRLDRSVAIKVSSLRFSQRFAREAHSVSALNHPNICTLYDVGSLPSGGSYMVTELVEGETVREWLMRSKQTSDVDQTIEIARQVLEALRAAHAAGIVHRDLKPANIMVRFDGYVKVLDFGLAKRMRAANRLPAEETVALSASVPGQIIGTVAYMSPEQIEGGDIDARSDLFAFGVVLYEMVAGRHPWPRKSTLEILFAILHDEPPPVEHPLGGMLQKLLRKNREDRYLSAEEVLEALALPPAPTTSLRRALTRLIVLPFRILRHHEETDFLAISLPDAITSSLAAIDSLVVRPTIAASRFAASAEIDVKTVAAQTQVDVMVTGTILSDGRRLRLNVQLIGASDAAVLWSETSSVSVSDIFQLHDELVNRIIQSLQLPLTAGEQRALKHDAPANPMSYHLYLNANHLGWGYDPRNLIEARDLYLRSLEADSKYAPAWASLGRTYRLIGKYAGNLTDNLALAEESFKKAFALNPGLALAHNYYTQLQTDLGRPIEAMERLLTRAREHRHDPQLFAGLVLACRYSGLPNASVAAHNAARRLDPHIRTSVVYSYYQLGQYQRVLDTSDCSDPYGTAGALAALGREHEAIAGYMEFEKIAPTEQLRLAAVFDRALLEGDTRSGLHALDQLLSLPGPFVHDPESYYWIARNLARANQIERALSSLTRAFDSGYFCHFAMWHDAWLESLRSQPAFTELVNRAAVKDQEARHVFSTNGGASLLGVYAQPST
jgi:serine/threonine protein kinase/tetratricopeptide (TPR) repeat protein